ncbi:MAG TPA: isochorismatase family protein [Opitutaceae bacterium]|jgi:nicotinamidase-related amidase
MTGRSTEGALLLCLDMQPPFLQAVAGGPALLRRCQFAVAAARGLGVAVAFTEQVPDKLGGTDPSLLALAGGTRAQAKDAFSALAPGSACREALTGNRHLEHLILCGLETPICVFQTAIDAIKGGLAVTVLSDCVGARRPADAAACLEALARAEANVLPAETVFYSILGGASHPYFREFSRLVKSHA